MTGVAKAITGGVVLGLSITAFAQARRDGQWEIKTEMSMPGMPMNMPTTTTTQCVTKQDAEDPQRFLPQNPQAKCTMSDYKITGDKVTWKMACQGQVAMTGTGEITYKGDTFESVMNMDGQGMKMIMKSTGKRLGDCVK